MPDYAKNRSNFIKASHRAPGLPPGTLIHIGELKSEDVTFRLISYNADGFSDLCFNNVDDMLENMDAQRVHWLDVYGLHDLEKIQKIATHFGIPPMMVEDILDTEQTTKVDDQYENLLFFIVKMFVQEPEIGKIDLEQVSIVMGTNFVITFQERPGDEWDPLRARIEKPNSRHRTHGAEYLNFTILDSIIDTYFLTLDVISDHIEALEIELLQEQKPEHIREIYAMKVELVYLRRSAFPFSEILKYLDRSTLYYLHQTDRVLLRELHDNQHAVMDRILTYNEILSGMMDLYHSNLSTRTNEVMRVLTIISTIFIPCTFITSLYGMNFKFMPELESNYGYFVVLGIIAALGLSLTYYFRLKRWL